MKKEYKHIFFDLDHTLWDYERNSEETLNELYRTHRLHELGNFTPDDLVQRFNVINRKLWRQFNNGKITPSYLRKKRFIDVFDSLGVHQGLIPPGFGDAYLELCPQKTNLIPYALETLTYLESKNYKLHIITNGFKEVQMLKLTNSMLKPFFMEIVTADCSGYKKPHEGIFRYSLEKAGAYCDECLMIGDNLEADILGAVGVAIDAVYYNRHGLRHKEKPTYEVHCLSQLQAIL